MTDSEPKDERDQKELDDEDLEEVAGGMYQDAPQAPGQNIAGDTPNSIIV